MGFFWGDQDGSISQLYGVNSILAFLLNVCGVFRLFYFCIISESQIFSHLVKFLKDWQFCFSTSSTLPNVRYTWHINSLSLKCLFKVLNYTSPEWSSLSVLMTSFYWHDYKITQKIQTPINPKIQTCPVHVITIPIL